ncbi:3-deoxy-D-manno-octulosonic acid transferase [Salinimicrobium soli]|uniref:3-deoxy-D-manno-octulosonic acid transferase n=1 Tax=Salinimicrobium soli TaxID=1254399 RepID=UPI003AB0A8B1
MKLFTEGRKDTFSILSEKIQAEDRTFWFHAASLGEYEQAVPVIEEVKKLFPEHKIIISFFSPSGYEIRKNSPLADAVVYLPLDTPGNAQKFIELAHPDWAIFIKYEFWPNFLSELKKRKIRTLLVSGAFRKDQLFFKKYGKWMRSYLSAFEHFFVQNASSGELMHSIGFHNVSLSGDTRFDRVKRQLEQDNELEFISDFKNGKTCVVAGSTWPEDEELLVNFINNSPNTVKFIIAPHTLNPSKLAALRSALKTRTVFYSEKEGKNLASYQVFVIDTIGLLSKIYSYAEIAYVGGAAGDTGLHNVLEPATFGLPVVIGQNFERFPEAAKLLELGGLFSISTSEELEQILQKLIDNRSFRETRGTVSRNFIEENTGATSTVMDYLAAHSAEKE